MIAWLKGQVIYIGQQFIILDVSGVGYEVNVTQANLLQHQVGHEVELFIHQSVREDGITLFGFPSHDELFTFRDLISVSGIGPKIALTVLNGHRVGQILEAITLEQETVFSGISGIGPKTARRIILELKGKVSQISTLPVMSQGSSSNDMEVVAALLSLGYSAPSARDVIKKISPDGDTAQRVKQALKYIGS